LQTAVILCSLKAILEAKHERPAPLLLETHKRAYFWPFSLAFGLLGLVPRQATTGGKPRLLHISKRGNGHRNVVTVALAKSTRMMR
jgi:hypothetical protein